MGINPGGAAHMTWKPDPSFYPSPRMASKAAPQTVAYVAAFDPDRKTPDRSAVVAIGNREGKEPGGIFLMDHESFDVLGQWEMDRGDQHLAYDAWWHLGHDTLVTSEWGTPDTFENGLIPEVLLGAKYGRRLHFWDLQKSKHLQTIDFWDKYQLVFQLPPAHDPTQA